MLEGGKVGGELVCRATAECCLTGAGVGEGGLVMEWMSLAGLGAVGGGTGLGETGGGIFFPSTTEMEREREREKSTRVLGHNWSVCFKQSAFQILPVQPSGVFSPKPTIQHSRLFHTGIPVGSSR